MWPYDSNQNNPEYFGWENSTKYIDLIFNPSTTYKIKNLQEHKSIEYKSIMPTKHSVFLKIDNIKRNRHYKIILMVPVLYYLIWGGDRKN